MRRLLRRSLGALALTVIAALSASPASADAVIAADGDVVSCQPAGTCVQVAVKISGVPRPPGFLGVRGVHVSLKIEGNIQLCSDTLSSNFTQGDFLTFGGAPTTGLYVYSDPTTGIITVDQAVTGDPLCRDADGGTLFVMTVKNVAATGNGTITVTEVAVRDCNNAAIGAAPGPPATIAFNGGSGQPLKLKLKPIPSTIWPPDGALHDIHIDASTTGGCPPVAIILWKIVVRCDDEGDDDDEKDIGTGLLNHEPLLTDIVGADYGQPDFDFKLRARECEESKDHLTLGESHDCENTCRNDCWKRCEDKIDYHCDRISDPEKREECEDEQREDREECQEHCDHDCGEDCERDSDLIYKIFYIASDASGNADTASTTVRVQHDSIVSASATLNQGQGDDLPAPNPNAPKVASLTVTIPSLAEFQSTAGIGGADALNHSIPGVVARSKPRFDASMIDRNQIFLGNASGLVAASGAVTSDVNQDGLKDEVARFENDRLSVVRTLSLAPGSHINLYFRDVLGNGYTMPNVLGDGWTWPVAPAPPPTPRRGGEPAVLAQPKAVTHLEAAYPNPARGQVSFVLELASAGEARVEVFDLRGAKVRTMVSGVQPAGRQVLSWDGLDDSGHSVPDGMYLVRARAGTYKATRSTVFIR